MTLDPKDPFFQTAISNMIDDKVDPLWVLVRQAPEAWHLIGDTGEPAFENGWVNIAAFGVAAAGFFRHNSVVHLKGSIKSGSNATIFTLPVGYRPSEVLFVAGRGNAVPATFQISSTGAVVPDGGFSATAMALDGISFRAEQ